MLNPVKRTDLTPEDIEWLELRKAWLLAQAKLLCEVYDAGKLREMYKPIVTGKHFNTPVNTGLSFLSLAFMCYSFYRVDIYKRVGPRMQKLGPMLV